LDDCRTRFNEDAFPEMMPLDETVREIAHAFEAIRPTQVREHK
jgi:hypothetical protein